MTFFSGIARFSSVFIVLGIGACSLTDDSDFYGYEDEYVLPEPDMIPVMPDDKPGRTVDEMLALTTTPVTVKKAVYAPVPESNRAYEHTGRFGSKEKISLRKGLNVPETGIIYGSQKRKEVENVRPLEVKDAEKDEIQVVSEEEMLAQIIAPKTTPVKMIEVVPAQQETIPAQLAALKELTVVPAQAAAPEVKAVETVQVTAPEVKAVETVQVTAPEVKAVETVQVTVPEVKAVETVQVTVPEVKTVETVRVTAPAEEQPAVSVRAPVLKLETVPPAQKLALKKDAVKGDGYVSLVSPMISAPVKEKKKEKLVLRNIREDDEPEADGIDAEAFSPAREEEIVLIPPLRWDGTDRANRSFTLIPPSRQEERIVLTSPQEERIVLIPPGEESLPSVEVFLDE